MNLIELLWNTGFEDTFEKNVKEIFKRKGDL